MEEESTNLYVRERTESENGTSLRETFKRSESWTSQTSASGSKDEGGSPTKLARDTVAVERTNLVNICKSVVKELLEQSLRFGRIVDSDNIPQQHFFIVLEHILRHGLKMKKGILGPKKEIWDILQCIEKHCSEAHDITTSVRELPSVKTPIGRARAWLRIALMQKKLADYLQVLIQNKNKLLSDHYEAYALIMTEDITIVNGILVGLNIIDFNFYIKEVDFDTQKSVIDFSLYLRSTAKTSPGEDILETFTDEMEAEQVTVMLDQKNYVEELNRQLKY